MLSFIYHATLIHTIGCPDKGTSVNSLATATAAIFPNADDHLSNCVKNPSQYNKAKLK